MQTHAIERRQVLRLVGAGALLGSFTGTAVGKEGRGRYIVGATSNAAADEARSRASAVTRVIDLGRVTAVAGYFSEQAVEALSRRRDVEYVEVDAPVRAIGEPEWGVDRVDAEVAHGSSETGLDAHVAIIDTGIDVNHVDLEPNIAPSGQHTAFVNCRGGGCVASYDDDHGHGTHCAGIAAAVDNDGSHSSVVGVAPDAVLHAVKVLDKNGMGWSSDVAAGIQWVADNAGNWGPTVASLSLGGGHTQTKKEACRNAYEAGVLVVAAAGNDGNSSACDDDDCVGYPAAYDTVVAVTATNRCDEITPWSSTGPQAEVAAPGAGIRSTLPGNSYDAWSGTSMACPHVSGAGALLMAKGDPNATNISFKNGGSSLNLTDDAYANPGGARGTLRDTAETVAHDPNGDAHDTGYGYGLLDVANALGLDTSNDLPSPLEAATEAATNVGETSATLNGSASGFYGCTEATGFFEWDTDSTTLDNTTTGYTIDRDNPDFSHALDGLTSGTTYYFRAVVVDGSVRREGTVESFTPGSGDGGSGGDDGGGSDTTSPTGDITDSDLIVNNNPHAEYSVDWTASDDSALAEVTVELRRTGESEVIARETDTSVNGAKQATGTTEVSEHMGARNSNTHEVRIVVTDAAGNPPYEGPWEPADQP